MDTVPDSTVRAVARKLRHYIDVERREDGFDRSSPLHPLGEFTSTRGGTLYYNSLQDKHLQHYFRKPMVRKRLEELGVVRQGAFEDKLAKNRHQQRTRSLESGIQNFTGMPASGRCRDSRLVNTAAKILTETGSTLSAYTPKNHGRKLSTHESYSSFASEIPPDQQSLSSKSGHSVSSQTGSTTPSGQAMVSTSPPASSRIPGGKRVEAPSAQQYPQGHLPSRSLIYPPRSHSILESRQANVLHSHSDSFVPTDATLNFISTAFPKSVVFGELQIRANRSRRCVVSVGVSTATSCDASTQTLVHAETQTEKSVLGGVRYGKDKRSKRRSGSKMDREVVSHQDPIALKATTQMMSEGGSTEPRRQRVESVDETTSRGDAADPLRIEPYNETMSKESSVEPQRVASQDERAPEEGSAEQLRVDSQDERTPEEEPQTQTVGSHDGTASEEEPHRQRAGSQDGTASEEEPQRQRVASQDGTASDERQRVGSQDGTASEEEPQRQRVASQDGTASDERQRVGSQDGTASEERQRVGSQDGTASDERQRVGSQDGTASEERQTVGSQDGTASEEEPHRQRAGSQDERAPEEETKRQQVESQDGTIPDEEPQRLRVGSQDGTASEERQRVASQDGTASDERQRAGSQDGTASEERRRSGAQEGRTPDEDPQRQRAGSQDGAVSEGGQNEASSEEVIQETTSDREAAVHTYLHEAVDPGDVDRLKELVSQYPQVLGEGGSHSVAGLLPPEQDDGGDEHLEDKWTSDTEQGTRSQSAEKQRQQQEPEMFEVKEGTRRDSSTFPDLAREEVENEGSGSSHENDTGSV